MSERAAASVRGVVQGVGFRPVVARLARSMELAGFVRNTAEGQQHAAGGQRLDFVGQVRVTGRFFLGGRQVRRAFLSPLGYRLTGVSRQDIDQGTAKALQAHAAMGELPEEVCLGARRAPHAPTVRVPLDTPIAAMTITTTSPPVIRRDCPKFRKASE